MKYLSYLAILNDKVTPLKFKENRMKYYIPRS